jgi:hypothetical protein
MDCRVKPGNDKCVGAKLVRIDIKKLPAGEAGSGEFWGTDMTGLGQSVSDH